MAKIKASVILPTYNESGNIIGLIESLRHELSVNNIVFEIIVVDDDSPDGTGILAQKYFSKYPEVRVVFRKNQRGLASAIRKGIEFAVGQIVLVMDTDFNHEPKLVPKLITKCNRYDVVVGSRFIKGGGMANKARDFYSRVFNIFLVKPILGSPVNDNLCGFFAMKRNKIEQLDFDKIFYGYGDYFIRLVYYAKKLGCSFTQIPAFYKDRTYGSTKSKFVQMLIDYTLSAIKLRLGL